MIECVHSTTNKDAKVGGATAKQQFKKIRTKRGNLDVPRFEIKVIALFHVKFKKFPWLCIELVNTCKIHF